MDDVDLIRRWQPVALANYGVRFRELPSSDRLTVLVISIGVAKSGAQSTSEPAAQAPT